MSIPYAVGDMMYATSTANMGYLNAGGTGSVLTVNSGVPSWSTTAPRTITGTLTSFQVRNLNIIPVTIIPAQGVGKVIRLISASAKMNYGTTLFIAAGSQTIVINYTASTVLQCTLLPNAQIIANSNQFCLPILAANSGANTIVDNQGIRLRNPITTEISGNPSNDSTISYSITYQVITI